MERLICGYDFLAIFLVIVPELTPADPIE